MNKWLMSAVLAAMTATAAGAQTPGGAERAQVAPASARVLYVCATDITTRREFAREYGEARFMTAEEISASAAAGERWTTPRCVREDELARYEDQRRMRQMRVAAAR